MATKTYRLCSGIDSVQVVCFRSSAVSTYTCTYRTADNFHGVLENLMPIQQYVRKADQ